MAAGTHDDEPGSSADLTWLAQRAADTLAEAFNEVSRAGGLTDLRDWLVLALISDDAGRTQLEIANELGIDKTTLMAIIDRLERDGLLVRVVPPGDRRMRIPTLTDRGRRVKDTVGVARDAVISERLAAIAPSDRPRFHAMLWSIVRTPPSRDSA